MLWASHFWGEHLGPIPAAPTPSLEPGYPYPLLPLPFLYQGVTFWHWENFLLALAGQWMLLRSACAKKQYCHGYIFNPYCHNRGCTCDNIVFAHAICYMLIGMYLWLFLCTCYTDWYSRKYSHITTSINLASVLWLIEGDLSTFPRS